jgi:hypothetical protein
MFNPLFQRFKKNTPSGSNAKQIKSANNATVGLPHAPLNKEHIFDPSELSQQLLGATDYSQEKRQWLGNAMQQVMQHVDRNSSGMRHSEPEILYIACTPETQASQWNEETVRHIVAQLPGIKQVVFQGPENPFRLMPELPEVLACFQGQYAVKTTVQLHPLHLNESYAAILKGSIDELIVDLGAHTPSSYGTLMRRPATEFMPAQDALYQFMTKRFHNPQARNNLHVWVNLVLNSANYTQIPTMLREAERWGVQGVNFNNATPWNGLGQWADATLAYSVLGVDDTDYQAFISTLDMASFRVAVRLPNLHQGTLVDSVSEGSTQGLCKAPYTTVALDGGFNTCACPRWIPELQGGQKFWQGDFWNAPHFQLARQIHREGLLAQLRPNQAQIDQPESTSAASTAIPTACLHCPMNCKGGAQGEIQNRHLLRF